MNAMEKKNTARNMTINLLTAALEENAAVQFGDASYAILQTLEDGTEIWTEITVKSKAAAFDPFEVAQEWAEEKKIKEAEKAEKAKEKAAKIARDKARREAKEKDKEKNSKENAE